MNSRHKTIRAYLTTMSPNRAINYIKSFHLRQDEENFLISLDVYGKSVTETAMEYNATIETVKRRRKQAYAHIADEIIEPCAM